MNWPLVPLGEVLTPFVDRVSLSPLVTYREVTVKWWGKGLAVRREMLGAETATHERVALKAGQFIISRIDARKGAAGVVPASLAGGVVTNDFPVFDIDDKRLLPAFLGY
jgi:type I restriction enzyme S subunit